PHTLTLARRLGAAVRAARAQRADVLPAIIGVTGGRILFGGKITDVERRTVAGFARGRVCIRGFDHSQARIAFQNENLIAEQDGRLLAVVPDLICIVDAESGEPITTELLRYGLRVTVLGIPAPPQLRPALA